MTTSAHRRARDREMLALGYLTVPSAANVLGLSQPRVYELAARGAIASRKVGGAVYLMRSSVESYQRANTPGPGWIPLIDAAAKYHYPRTTMLYWIQQGRLESRKIGRRAYVYEPALAAMAK